MHTATRPLHAIAAGPAARGRSSAVIQGQSESTGPPPSVVLCFTVLCRHRLLYLLICKLKVCGHPVSSESVATIFPAGSDDG